MAKLEEIQVMLEKKVDEYEQAGRDKNIVITGLKEKGHKETTQRKAPNEPGILQVNSKAQIDINQLQNLAEGLDIVTVSAAPPDPDELSLCLDGIFMPYVTMDNGTWIATYCKDNSEGSISIGTSCIPSHVATNQAD